MFLLSMLTHLTQVPHSNVCMQMVQNGHMNAPKMLKLWDRANCRMGAAVSMGVDPEMTFALVEELKTRVSMYDDRLQFVTQAVTGKHRDQTLALDTSMLQETKAVVAGSTGTKVQTRATIM
jgi:hypothetical protein